MTRSAITRALTTEESSPLPDEIHPPRTVSTDTTDAATNWKRGGPSSVPTSSGRTYSMPTPAARGAARSIAKMIPASVAAEIVARLRSRVAGSGGEEAGRLTWSVF